MDKKYKHKELEEEIYRKWENKGYFTPKVDKKKTPYCIIMPPPNANDNLHIGHARFITIQDILIRYHRMKGSCTLWLPGADHAGIETQFVFEKKLKKLHNDTIEKREVRYLQNLKKQEVVSNIELF